MATVVIQKRQRQKGSSYVITYKDPMSGRKRYYKTFRKKHDADTSANELRYLIDTGKFSSNNAKGSKKLFALTLDDVCEMLLEQYDMRCAEGKLSQVTYDGYRVRIQQIRRVFGHRRASEVTEAELLEYRSQIVEQTSNVNANRIMFVVKQIFNYAVELEAISENPATAIRQLSEKKHERNLYLLPDELAKLLEASQQTRGKHYLPALILLGAEHGTSKQEALSLKWQDINFDYNGTGLINFYRTKNKKERTETLMPQTKAALLQWKEHLLQARVRRNIEPVDTTYVFCRLNGKPIASFNKVWRRTTEHAGFKNFHYHDLRHTFCSNLLLVGAELKDVKDMIGHSDIAMTDRYTHLANGRKTDIQNRLSLHYQGIWTE
jgi:site-specific recombinase XerD